jgi:uncharacterized membrane protein (UPF0127 family)
MNRFLNLFLFALVFGLLSCNTNDSGSGNVVRKERPEPKFRDDGLLWVTDNDRQDTLVEVRIEIVEKDKDIQYGMMHRKSMDPMTGMFFIMKQERPQSFYMKNTYIPLDIIYINSNKEIVSIVENAEPLNEKSLPSGAPALYILEVTGGFCAKHGVGRGMTIDFQRHKVLDGV